MLVEEQRWNDIKTSLKKQLLLVYSPVHPDKFLEYKLEGTNWTGNTSYSDCVMTGDVIHNVPAPVVHRKSLAEAIHGIGGIGVFLFLFAKVQFGNLCRASTLTLPKYHRFCLGTPVSSRNNTGSIEDGVYSTSRENS